MKKLLLLIIALLLLTSCSEKTAVDQEKIDKSETVTAAVELFESCKLLPALDMALKASEYTECQRIIASVTGAYKNGTGLLSKTMTVPQAVKSVELSENGDFMAVSDGTAVYLADYEKAEIVATLPNGDFWFKDGMLYIVGGKSYAYNMSGEQQTANVEEKKNDQCEIDGRVFRFADGKVTDGVWEVEYKAVDGFMSIFPLDHEMYNKDGDVVMYHSVVLANGKRLTAFDRDTGEVVFDTELKDEILTCQAGDGAVIIGTSKMLSTGGQLFSNKANSPLFPEGDMLRLSDTYKFGEARQSTAYAQGRIATAAIGSNEVELLFKVSYDTHRKLSIEARYPTAVADHEGILAIGTYEYVDGQRHNYFIEYDLKNDSYTKTEIEHTIDDIYYADGWQICGDGRISAIGGVAQYKHQQKISVGTSLEYGNKTVSLDINSNILTDSEGNSADIGFTLNEMSEICYADNDTLFITEYRYSGKAVLLSLPDMKIKAEVENGIYFVKSANAILYLKGSSLGLYEYRGEDFSYIEKEWTK